MPQAIGGWAARWIRADVVLLATVLAVLVWFVGPVLMLVLAGVLLAIAFEGLTAVLARLTRMPRGAALLLVLVGFVLALVAAAFLVVPAFVEQVGQVWDAVAELGQRAIGALQRQPWAEELLGLGQQGGDEQAVSPGAIAARVASATMTMASAALTVIIVFAIGVFIAADPGLYRTGLVKLFPFRSRPRAEEVLSALGHSLHWWLMGQLVSMTVLFTVTSLGLWLVGVEAWLGLGLLVGLFTFIPYLGPILAGIPVLVVSFAEGLETGLIVLGFYVVLQNLEGNFLTPLVQQQAVHMPPALMISVQVLMAAVFGFAGLLLAAPLAVIGLVLVNLLYVEDVLGDRPTEL